MTVAELIKALDNFDDDAEVEVFECTGISGEILSRPLDNYCIIGNKGQAVIMPEEPFESRGKILKRVYEDIQEVIASVGDLTEALEDIAGICIEDV